MTFFAQANGDAIEFLLDFFPEDRPSWTGDGIQGHVLKMEKDGEIVSAIIYQQLEQDEKWVFIHAIGTSQLERHKGHAKSLFENLMKKDGAPLMIFLQATNSDLRLLQKYRNIGFIPSCTHDVQLRTYIESVGAGGNKTLVLDTKA
jgi:hypothetical protein